MKKSVIFDLDGTLTDSGPGIMGCAAETFKHYHLPVPCEKDLRTFVGPPLRDSFRRFGMPENEIENAILCYRDFYTASGKYNNIPYAGIEQLLAGLKARGHRLYVATSKPEDMSVDILKHFRLAGYFDIISGASRNAGKDGKAFMISQLKERVGLEESFLMVGDTVFDIVGAAAHGIPAVGVSWGYGIEQVMLVAGAVGIAHSMKELLELIERS